MNTIAVKLTINNSFFSVGIHFKHNQFKLKTLILNTKQ